MLCKSVVRFAGITAGIMLVTFSHMNLYAITFTLFVTRDTRSTCLDISAFGISTSNAGDMAVIAELPENTRGKTHVRDSLSFTTHGSVSHDAQLSSATDDAMLCSASASRMTPR